MLRAFPIGTEFFVKTARSIERHPHLNLSVLLETVLPDDNVLFRAPMYNDRLYPIGSNEMLFVHRADQEGRYDFLCRVIEAFDEDGLPLLLVQPASEIAYSQRRDYIRVKKNIKGRLGIERPAGPRDNRPQTIETECVTYDISGSGLCIYAQEPCEPDETITIRLPLDPDKALRAYDAIVMWCRPTDRDDFKHLLGLRFQFGNNQEREDLISFVLQLQFEQRRAENR